MISEEFIMAIRGLDFKGTFQECGACYICKRQQMQVILLIKGKEAFTPIPSPSADFPRPLFWVTSSTEQDFKGKAGVIYVSDSYPTFHLGFQTSIYTAVSSIFPHNHHHPLR